MPAFNTNDITEAGNGHEVESVLPQPINHFSPTPVNEIGTGTGNTIDSAYPQANNTSSEITGRLATLFGNTTRYYLINNSTITELSADSEIGNLYRYEGKTIRATGYMFGEGDQQKFFVESWTPLERSQIEGFVSGAQSTIVILVEFSDNTASHSVSYFQQLVFVQMNFYYVEVSFNAIQVTGGTTAQWYKLSHPTTYYSVHGWGSTWTEYRKLASDVVSLVDPDVNFASYSHYIMVFAGDWVWGAMASGLWISTNDGVMVNSVTFQRETYGMSVFAHEFGHDLGLPDLYDYSGSDPYDFIDGWDLMSVDNAQHLSSWSKIELGWIPTNRIRTFTGAAFTETVNRIEYSTSGYQALKIQTSSNIYFLVEVRQKIGYDLNLPSAAPDHGVLITKIDESLQSGYGIVRLIDANPSTEFYWDGDAVWQAGQTYTDITYNFSISIQSWTGTGFVITVSPRIVPLSNARSYVAEAPENTVYFVYPNYQGPKPPGVIAAYLSDWTATGFMAGNSENRQYEVTDTNSAVIDTGSGAVELQGKTVVLFGGPIVNAPVHYYETNRIAPLYYQYDNGKLYWWKADGTRLDATGLSSAEINTGQDMFVVESFIDSNGNHVFIVYGYGWKGTYAGGKFVKFIMYPGMSSYTGSYYVFKWVDSNSDGFVGLSEILTAPIVQG